MWINTSTLFVRYNTAVWLAGGSGQFAQANRGGGQKQRRPLNAPAAGFVPNTGTSPDAVVDQWVTRLIGRPIDADKRQTLIDSMNGRADREDNVRKMVQLLVSMPDYQLC
jgi:hypothetical protein